MRITMVSFVFIVSLTAAAIAQDEPAVSGITVETQMCTAIEERMPVGAAQSFSADLEKVFIWCHVLGAVDTTQITLQWYWKDELMATVDLPVRSPSWRTWSSKNLWPTWTGNWEVKVLDFQGEILKAVTFTVTEPTAAAETPPPPEPVPDTTMPDSTK